MSEPNLQLLTSEVCWSCLIIVLQPLLQVLWNFAHYLLGPSSVKVIFQAMILLPAKCPLTNCGMGSILSFSVQSSDDGRDVSSSVPQCDDPLSVIARQLRGHTSNCFYQTLELTFKVQLLRLNPTVLARIPLRKLGLDLDLLRHPQNVVETYTLITNSNVNFQLPSFTHTCGKRVRILHAWQMHSTWLSTFNHYCNSYNEVVESGRS